MKATVLLVATFCTVGLTPECRETVVMPFASVDECSRQAQPVLAEFVAAQLQEIRIVRYKCGQMTLQT